jgi:molecular chaperone HscC
MSTTDVMVGIDLGTTNSLVAVWKEGKSTLIPNGLAQYLTPSAINIDKQDKILVGQAALDRLLTQPQATTSIFKRAMGSEQKIQLGKQYFRAEELSSFVLRALKADAEAFLGCEVTEAVISVPAYFNDTQRKATKAAGELAGLKVRRLINEPTAAAIAYGLHQNFDNATILVLDLGGGTFDVSLLELYEGIIEVHASCGDNYLGGEDFLHVVVEKFLNDAKLIRDDLTANQLTEIRELAETCKRTLSTESHAKATWLKEGDAIEFHIDRSEFEQLSTTLIQRLRSPIEQALMDGKVSSSELDAIILVGGSTRMPLVRSLVAKMFGRLPHCDINPDEVVAQGAAIQAGLILRDKALEETVLTDVCPYTLGIETSTEISANQFQSKFLPLIERNMPVPISRVQTVFPLHDSQSKINLDVYQGESFKVERNIKLGSLNVEVPKSGNDIDRSVDVRFTYDINGILEVIATVIATNEQKKLVIEQNPGTLSQAEIAKRLKELEKIKIHPRDEQENQLALSRAERLYEQTLGDLREYVGGLISEFESVLDTQNIQLIDPARKALNETLEQIEKQRLF